MKAKMKKKVKGKRKSNLVKVYILPPYTGMRVNNDYDDYMKVKFYILPPKQRIEKK